MTAATKFGAWSTPQSELQIEYSLVVLDEIRRSVTDGFQRLRGGMEVGGVLYGTRDESKLRIEAIRDIVCEYAQGPSFHLSENDHAALSNQIAKDQEDPRLKGYVALGWFVSHPRKDIALTPGDVEIYDRYFPESWQITLVIRPGRAGLMRAGFFVRDADGQVKTDRSYQDFNFPEMPAGVIPAMLHPISNTTAPNAGSAREGARGEMGRSTAHAWERSAESQENQAPSANETPLASGLNPSGVHSSGLSSLDSVLTHGLSSASLSSAAMPVAEPAFEASQRSFGEPPLASAPSNGFKVNLRLVPVIGVAALIGALASFAGLRALADQKTTEPISLAVFDHAGQLQIQWNHSSGALSNARNGSIEIEDGGNKQTFSLTPQDLAQGSYTYVRKTGDVQVRMQVVNSHGQQKQEASRFLGTAGEGEEPQKPETATPEPSATAIPPATPPASSAELEAAREETARQRTRIQQLERTIVILQGRLGVNQDK